MSNGRACGMSAETADNASRPLVLVSACLLGERVRYDGELRPDRHVLSSLGPHVAWMRVCPESDAGLPTPRPPMDRVGTPKSHRLINSDGKDLTDVVLGFTRKKLDGLAQVELCGYVCRARSPSSGMLGVDLHGRNGRIRKLGPGVFTGAFMERFPQVPVEQNDRLADPLLLASFAERVFARKRWLDLLREGQDPTRLVEFHTDHRFQLLSHGRTACSELEWLVGVAGDLSPQKLFSAYGLAFMALLSEPPSRASVADALLQMAGLVRKLITRRQKTEMSEAIDGFRKGLVSLPRPLEIIRHHASTLGLPYLVRQTLLAPYPETLMPATAPGA